MSATLLCFVIGVGASGLGRLGGAAANTEAFTETRWITVRGEPAGYPF